MAMKRLPMTSRPTGSARAAEQRGHGTGAGAALGAVGPTPRSHEPQPAARVDAAAPARLDPGRGVVLDEQRGARSVAPAQRGRGGRPAARRASPASPPLPAPVGSGSGRCGSSSSSASSSARRAADGLDARGHQLDAALLHEAELRLVRLDEVALQRSLQGTLSACSAPA
jgi:hypothetical protein